MVDVDLQATAADGAVDDVGVGRVLAAMGGVVVAGAVVAPPLVLMVVVGAATIDACGNRYWFAGESMEEEGGQYCGVIIPSPNGHPSPSPHTPCFHLARSTPTQVTQVERGQKLGDAEGSRFMDVSVEELCNAIKDLGQEESAVEAVRHGLHYLDAGALAALLKVGGLVVVCSRFGEDAPWRVPLGGGTAVLSKHPFYKTPIP